MNSLGTPKNTTELAINLLSVIRSKEHDKIKEIELHLNDYIRNKIQLAYLFHEGQETQKIVEHITKLLLVKYEGKNDQSNS